MSEEPSGSGGAPTPPDGVQDPPQTPGGILKKLGPGLIVAGSIVGSGELIATTAVGAEAGFWLLWLILIGCVIKVFTQVELGRYSIVTSRTTMDGMNEVPGPAVELAALGNPRSPRARGNWLIWFWFLMFLASLAQLGGIVGGVGQALSISVPLTENGKTYNEIVDSETKLTVALRTLERRVGKTVSITSATADAVKELRYDLTGALDETREESAVVFRERISYRLDSISENDDWIARGIAWRTLFEVFRSKLPDEHRARALGIIVSSPRLSGSPDEEIRKLRDDVRELASVVGRSKPETVYDDRIWATIIATLTAFILYIGRYGLIQSFATAMVCIFTLITLGNLAALQTSDTWAVTMSEFIDGLKFAFTPADQSAGDNPLRTALFTFGIIGVGASELVTYPYWCIEKGYARFTGPRDDSEEWAERARGWMRVLRWDAWCSMVVYTFATVAFYLLGAAILWRSGLNPAGTELIRTLAVMYEPVFGAYAPVLFLFGAFAVLYSTFFVANASHARVFPDALRVLGLGIRSREDAARSVRIFSAIFPFVCLIVYLFVQAPKELVLLSGMMQAIMLPMLAGAALWFRFRRCDPRIQPGGAWDLWLWISALGMLLAGAGAIYTKFA